MKKLIIKKNDTEYVIDFYDIRYTPEFTVISGYDVNGMYYQMKIKKYSKVETETAIHFEI